MEGGFTVVRKFLGSVMPMISTLLYKYIYIYIKIAVLTVSREIAEKTVFKGKIVITKGLNKCSRLKSVEAYDYYDIKWTNLLELIKGRWNHAAVSMVNKMFVIGGVKVRSKIKNKTVLFW